jgi:hypothetical protein
MRLNFSAYFIFAIVLIYDVAIQKGEMFEVFHKLNIITQFIIWSYLLRVKFKLDIDID